MWSVKDLTVQNQAYENQPGVGRFKFSDRYSVFDWGAMPDQIENKGKALLSMAAFNFEKLEDMGIKTHYRGLVTPEGKLVRFEDLEEGSNGLDTMEIDLGVVYKPIARQLMLDGKPSVNYDYSLFANRQSGERNGMNNFLVPLEIIFRNGVPKGSSVFDRIAAAKRIPNASERDAKLTSIYSGLGLKEEPKEGDMLPKPVMNYTTKLEAGDRGLSREEALDISGLEFKEFSWLEGNASKVNDFITKQAQKTGFIHYDGKVEMIWNNGPVLCDVAGTLDEDRFSFKGEQVSKEVLRDWYVKHQREFRPACKEYEQTGPGWQERCPVKPIKLDEKIPNIASQMYMSAANRYTEKKIFNAVELEDVMEAIRPFR